MENQDAVRNLLKKCQEQECAIMTWEKRYRTLAIRANQLERLVGDIAMLLRKDMTEASADWRSQIIP